MAFVLLTAAGWWRSQRPTADMRYVGTWERSFGGTQEVYWPNGMGAILHDGKPTTRFHWTGNDTTFMRGQNAGGPPLLSHLAAFSWKTFGGPQGWLHDVEFISPDEIRLTPRTPGTGMGNVTLRRVKPRAPRRGR